MTAPPNSLRGEFSAVLAGESFAFDTTLGTIVRIEEACGGRSIMEVVNGVVFRRRASDQQHLLAATLAACGHAEAAELAACATVPEAEAFILALMQALGFKLAARSENAGGAAAGSDPLAGSSAGAAGAPSRSAA